MYVYVRTSQLFICVFCARLTLFHVDMGFPQPHLLCGHLQYVAISQLRLTNTLTAHEA